MRIIGLTAIALTLAGCAGDAVAPRQPIVRKSVSGAALAAAQLQNRLQDLRKHQVMIGYALANARRDSVQGSHSAPHEIESDLEGLRTAWRDLNAEIEHLQEASPASLNDLTPVYPEGTRVEFVEGGTWLKLDKNVGFSARTEATTLIQLKTSIYGSTSQGFDGSSDDGVSIEFTYPKTVDVSSLAIPADKRDCGRSSVTFSGNSTHSAFWGLDGVIAGVSFGVRYQRDARTRRKDDACPHTPVRGDLAINAAEVDVGGMATGSVIWHGSSQTIVHSCSATWSASVGGVVSFSGEGSTITIVGVSPGTVSVTAYCNGIPSNQTTLRVRGSTPPPPSPPGGGGPTCRIVRGAGSPAVPHDVTSDCPPPPPPPTGGGVMCWWERAIVSSQDPSTGEWYEEVDWYQRCSDGSIIDNRYGATLLNDRTTRGPRHGRVEEHSTLPEPLASTSAARGKYKIRLINTTSIPRSASAAVVLFGGPSKRDLVVLDAKRVTPNELAATVRLAVYLHARERDKDRAFVLASAAPAITDAERAIVEKYLQSLKSAKPQNEKGFGQVGTLDVEIAIP